MAILELAAACQAGFGFDGEPEAPAEAPAPVQVGLGLAVPFAKSRELVILDLERAESDRREPRILSLDGDGPGELEG